MKYNFDHPELLIAAPDLSPQDFRRISNAIGLYVSLGNRIRSGEPVDLADLGVSLTFAAYSNAVFERYATDVDHESGDTLPVLWAELTTRSKKSASKKSASK